MPTGEQSADDDSGRPAGEAADRRGPERSHQNLPRRRPKRRSRHQGSGQAAGSIRLIRIAGNDFELAHPRKVKDVDLDYEEGLEIWKAGDPEGARDALRHALAGCRDNLWVHVALGQIALSEFRDPTLARGHFGYAVELAQRALAHGFTGRLPRDRPSNRPFYEAIEGLIQCYEALGGANEAGKLRAFRDRLCKGADRHSPGH
jgi:hypothetical protein